MPDMNRQVQLAKQPDGVPVASDFKVVDAPRPKPGHGQFLVRNIYLSLDPYMRGAIAGRHMGHKKLEPGQVIYGRCVGQVVESDNPDFKVGEYIVHEPGWQQYAIVDGKSGGEFRKVDAAAAPLSTYISVLGMPGLTAWAGVEHLAKPSLGQTFVVSAAAGPVGGTAGQLAQLKGARAVGIAGSPAKCRMVVDTYGFAACVNYKDKDWTDQLRAACPDGIDGYFDNVGGPTLDAVTQQLNLNGRIVLCGLMSQYNRAQDNAWNGHNMGPFIGKRAVLMGLVVYDYYARFPEYLKTASRLVRDGRLKFHEDRAVGLENAPAHFVKLMNGQNEGKALVVVGPER